MRNINMKHHRIALVVSLMLGLVGSALATTARKASWSTGEAFYRTNGEPIHRFTLTPDSTTAEDNTNAAGGNAVTYTLVGGERICFQSPEAAYVEVIASASMTAAGAKGFRVGANEPLTSNCHTLQPGTLKVSALCVSGSCTGVKGFEVR